MSYTNTYLNLYFGFKHPLWLILYISVTMTHDFSEAEKANRQGCVQAYLLTEKICSN